MEKYKCLKHQQMFLINFNNLVGDWATYIYISSYLCNIERTLKILYCTYFLIFDVRYTQDFNQYVI